MRTTLILLLLLAMPAEAKVKPPVVVITTTLGVIKAEIDDAGAPVSAANFLAYVDAGFYDGTIFNRVIRDFVVQGGGYTPELRLKPARPPIRNEGSAKRKNKKGTLAMARVEEPDSATSHFFINTRDNPSLDWQSDKDPGYAVFGKVIAGMDVVKKIERTPTAEKKGIPDVPVTPVIIVSIRRQP